MKLFSQLQQWFQKTFSSVKSKNNTIIDARVVESKTSTKSEKTITLWPISNGQITIFWVIGVIVIYAAYLAFQSLALLYLILAWILISVAMEVFISLWQKWLHRWVSIAISYLLLILFMITGIFIILPFVLQQLSSIISVVISHLYIMGQQINILWLSGYVSAQQWMPDFIQEQLLNFLANNSINNNIQKTIMDNISSFVSTGSDYAQNIGSFALWFIWSFIGTLGQIGLVLTIAVFFSIEKLSVRKFFVEHIAKSQESSQNLASRIDVFYKKMWLWIKAQFWLCLYIAVMVYVVLLILSIFGITLPNMVALALMAGFTEIVPYIWPILWAIPAVILATSIYGLKGFIITSIAYFVIQWTENNVLIPLLMNKSLGVNPLLIFLCVLMGWSVLWFIGILLAVPLSIIVTMVIKKDFE